MESYLIIVPDKIASSDGSYSSGGTAKHTVQSETSTQWLTYPEQQCTQLHASLLWSPVYRFLHTLESKSWNIEIVTAYPPPELS